MSCIAELFGSGPNFGRENETPHAKHELLVSITKLSIVPIR